MPVWAWVLLSILLSLAGLALLLLALFHVRYEAAWSGRWQWSESRQEGFARVDVGFPGFMRRFEVGRREAGGGSEEEGDSGRRTADGGGDSVGSRESGVGSEESGDDGRRTAEDGESSFRTHHSEASPIEARPSKSPPFSSTSPSSPLTPYPLPPTHEEIPAKGSSSSLPTPDSRLPTGEEQPPKKPDPHRWRRALFALATDAAAWGLVTRYALRVPGRVRRLLRPRVVMAAGHPDPALLGRLAGHWAAVSPLLPLDDVAMGYRFQDREPSFSVRVSGGVSALSMLVFGGAMLATFPWIGLGRRAWRHWRHHRLEGWRAWVYGKLQ
jgi:hypothetical protein